MNDAPFKPPSLDPRTWIGPKPDSDPSASPVRNDACPGGASFDPRTWAARDLPSATVDATETGPIKTGRRAVVVAGLAAIGAGALASATWLARRRPAPVTSAGPDSATPPPTDVERRAFVVASPGDIEGALRGVGVGAGEAASAADLAVTRLPATGGDLTLVLMMKPAVDGNRLVSLEASHEDGAGVVIGRGADAALVAHTTAADLKTVVKVVRGEMDAYSFYSSAVSQHLTDSLISPFASALAFDFDFQREIHAGDIFEAAFEDRINVKGDSVRVGRLLYVSLETKAKSRALYRFQPSVGEAGWFDGNGASTIRSLMRTPVEGARISSTFGMRMHPVLGFMKMHPGVDFAAPVGTPIYAAGDGSVIFAAMARTAGNRVILRHDNGWETWYLHLSAFGPGVVTGARVRQGQQIGAIGVTGRVTGPHLHYEVHIDSQPVDPMSIKMDSGRLLDGAPREAFFKERDRIDALREAQTG